MSSQKDIYLELNHRIEFIKHEIVTGKISLLELELKDLFKEMEGLIDVYNLEQYSGTYMQLCGMLEQKFEELKKLLTSIDDYQKIIEYLQQVSTDEEIFALFAECWIDTFNIEDLSVNFLTYAANRFCKENVSNLQIDHLKITRSDEEFLIEVPELQFIEKLDQYFIKIKDNLPCVFDSLFEAENEQIKIYEHFIFLLHLLQLGKVKYHKETNMLYL